MVKLLRQKVIYYYSKILKKLRGVSVSRSDIHCTSKIESGSHIVNITMKRHSFCGYDCEIVNTEIGSFCSIASGVIIGGEMHPMDWVSTSPVFYEGRDSVKAKFSEYEREASKKVTIGHDVWIGQNALIKQGVAIGTGAVIGMGSVVTKDVAPYSIVAGNPAGVIRMRFKKDIAERLLASKWWQFSDEELLSFGKHITNPIQFLEAIKK